MAKKVLKFIKLYGWVIILAFLILFSIMSFYPYRRGGPYLTSRCIFGDEINRTELQIISDDGTGHGLLKFRAFNKVATIASFEFSAYANIYDGKWDQGQYIEIESQCMVSPNSGKDIKQDELMEIICTFPRTIPNVGDKIKFLVNASYESKIPFKGEIYGPIQ